MAMNSESASTGNSPAFSISLTQHPYTDQSFSRRYIVLSSQNPILKIGRSSKLASKGFVPSSQNGWYDSPVMSRQHAEIIADFTSKRLKLRDLGSLHGTYVNESDQRLEKDQQVEIKDGDNIRFGVDIMRKKTFPPTIVKVGLDYIEPPMAKPEPDTTHPRASSTFRVPDGSDSDMECLDEDPVFDRSPKGTAVGRGLSGLSWKGEVIDLTHPVSRSSKIITNFEKQVVDLDQDDDYESNWCQSDELDDFRETNGSRSQPNIPFAQPLTSSVESNASNRSNYGSDLRGFWASSVDAIPPTTSHVVDEDSEMSSDYEPEYEPESAGSEMSRGDLSDDDASSRGFEYDYPYSESDSDFSVGQDSDAELESDEGGVLGMEAAEPKPSSNWAMPDLSNVVTGPTSASHIEAEPNHDKGLDINRLATPELKGDVISRNTPPVNPASPTFSAESPLLLALTHRPDVQLATPKSNKSVEETEEASPIRKSQNGHVVEMAEAPWYPPDKAEFFEAWKANKTAMMQTLPAASQYSRVAISDMLGENVSVGKGKRKADDISSSTEEELQWNAGEAQKSGASGANEAKNVSEVIEVDQNKEVSESTEAPTEPATEIAVTVESLDLPISVATSTLRVDVDDDSDRPRPAKRQRLRNIAERVGYVALGGVATGAMMFGALVYTAPTFV